MGSKFKFDTDIRRDLAVACVVFHISADAAPWLSWHNRHVSVRITENFSPHLQAGGLNTTQSPFVSMYCEFVSSLQRAESKQINN